MNKKTVLLVIGIAIVISLIQNYQKHKGDKHKNDNELVYLNSDKEIDVSNYLVEIDNNYRLGNNKMLEGFEETGATMQVNKFGDILNISVSNKFYVAKGYFEKMIDNLTKLKDTTSETSEIKENLIKASKTRIEAIELYTKGCYLKEQIGKISVANAMAAFQGGSPNSIPEYHGEIENSIGKVTVANSYIVDALRKLKSISDKTYLKALYNSSIARHISYYSDISGVDYDSYVNDGEYYLKNKNYFEAVISYNKALRVRPKERNLFIGVIKSNIGIGDEEEAEKKSKEALRLFPNDEELLVLNAEINKK